MEKGKLELKNSFPTRCYISQKRYPHIPRIKCLYFRLFRVHLFSAIRYIHFRCISMLFITIRFDEQIFKRSRNRKIIYRLLWNYNIRLWYIHDGHNLHTLFNGILCAANQELIGSCNLSFIYPEHDLSPFLPFFFQNRAITRLFVHVKSVFLVYIQGVSLSKGLTSSGYIRKGWIM